MDSILATEAGWKIRGFFSPIPHVKVGQNEGQN